MRSNAASAKAGSIAQIPVSEVAPLTLDRHIEILKALATALAAAAPLSVDDRRRAAAYIGRLAKSRQATKAIAARRGRPRRTDYLREAVALHYFALVMKNGKNNAKAAKHDVATAWEAKGSTVADYITECRMYAEARLHSLVPKSMTVDALIMRLNEEASARRKK